MGRTTAIEWTEHTWNPVTGCTKISEGCQHCYAERMARRLGCMNEPMKRDNGYPPPPDHFAVTLHPERLLEPLHWRKPSRVFVCSMGDLFHEAVPDSFIDIIWATMALRDRHCFQLLTKRPARMLEYLRGWDADPIQRGKRLWNGLCGLDRTFDDSDTIYDYFQVSQPWPLANVWLGVTAENQARADERIPLLLQTPAAVRFVSCEPLLGPVDFRKVPGFNKAGSGGVDLVRNFWVIVGPETGPGARPMNLDWARSLQQQCAAAHVAYFYKRGTLDGVTYHEYPEATK
jgi:protein gp37